MTLARARPGVSVALLAYGLAGLVLILLTAGLLLAALGAAERLAGSVDPAGPDGVVARLAPVETTLAEAELAVRGFDVTLDGTAAATRSGRDLTAGLAEALRRLAASLDVTILGTRPFAGVGAEFGAVATDAEALAGDLATTTEALARNRAALARLAGEIGDLQAEVAALRADLGGTRAGAPPGSAGEGPGSPLPVTADEAFSLSRVVLVLLLAWLAVPALVAVGVGLRRLRAG